VFDAGVIAESVERELERQGTKERAEKEKAYLKSDLVFFGAGMTPIKNAVRAFRHEHRDLDHDGLIALVDRFWERGIHELRAAAVVLLESSPKLLGPADVARLERLVRESKTWAYVDALAVAVIGPIVEKHPAELHPILDRWAKDEDFWVRRTAMLALLRPLRKGGGEFARFAGYADVMLDEREFFIRKAIGWILREVSKKRPSIVIEWIAPRAHRASGVTLREAVKYLPEADRTRILDAKRSAGALDSRTRRR
jgi:3-methyladenine DNA glycosylase AlkD